MTVQSSAKADSSKEIIYFLQRKSKCKTQLKRHCGLSFHPLFAHEKTFQIPRNRNIRQSAPVSHKMHFFIHIFCLPHIAMLHNERIQPLVEAAELIQDPSTLFYVTSVSKIPAACFSKKSVYDPICTSFISQLL